MCISEHMDQVKVETEKEFSTISHLLQYRANILRQDIDMNVPIHHSGKFLSIWR